MWGQGFVLICLMALFLVSLELLKFSFVGLGNEALLDFIQATNNPFIGLFIGLLVTAILQSSSTSTAMTVTMVAAGTLTLDHAIPIVMGANIGTTVTSALVSLSHVSKKSEFRKAIAVALTHNFFNLCVVFILFPLELFTHFLSRTSTVLAKHIHGIFPHDGSFQLTNFDLTGSLASGFQWIANSILGKENPALSFSLLLIIGVALLFSSVRLIAHVIKLLVIDKSREKFESSFFGNQFKSLGWGFLFTSLVQSSSVTTSLVVPLVGTGRVSVGQAFPFVMGSNVGTTVTALIAALYKPELALSIALVHVLLNLVGVVVFFPIPFIRQIPVQMARSIGSATVKNRLFGFIYILMVFFLIPFLLILVSNQ